MSGKKIKVAVACSNDLFSVGIRGLLAQCDFIQINEVMENGHKWSVSKFNSLKKHIILADIITLYNCFPSIQDISVWPKIILLDTNCGRENIISTILTKKICGVLPCESNMDILLKSIKMVDEGELCIDKEIVKNLIHAANSSHISTTDVLTAREKDITEFVGQGYRNKEIAKRLHISESTVKTHMYRIFQKLNMKTRSELVAYAIRYIQSSSAI